MKTLLLITSCLLLAYTASSQTNATDATVTDCGGTTYNLFDELDAGKIIVIGWTMPCFTCAGPLLEAHNSVMNFAVSNPGMVEYWVTDDYANSTCSSIENWCVNNGINNAKYFSSSELNMNHYGENGMPKVVVLGCTDHKVYYNVNDNPTGAGVTAAIDEALNDLSNGCQSVGTEELSESIFEITCYPNPTSAVLNIELSTEVSEELEVSITGLNGNLLSQTTIAVNSSHEEDFQLDVSGLANGIYFLNVRTSTSTITKKIEVTN
ncbi:MAG: hypothetical protein Crog4KO_16410 [Crocinitomicaceae bacterium]